MSRQLFNISMEGDTRTSLRKSWLCSVPLRVKNCFLMFRGSLLYFNLCCCLLSCHWAPLRRPWLLSLLTSPPGIYIYWWDSPGPSLLYLSQLLLTCTTLQFLHLLCRHSLDSLPYVHISCFGESTTGHSTLGVALPCWAEGKDNFPACTGDIMPNAAHNTTSILCGQGALLDHVQPVSSRTPGSFSPKHLSSLSSPRVYGCLGLFLLVQAFALLWVGLHEALVSTFVQPVQIPLDGSKIFQSVSHSSHSTTSSRNRTFFFSEETPP